MSQICLVRHGETDWNAMGKIQGRTDIPLNSIGKRQARECGEHLACSHWDRVITSPLKRAKQTAEIINTSRQLPLIEMEEFVERGYGEAEGMSKDERLDKFPNGHIPKQEERSVLNERVMQGLEKIQQRYPNDKIILVAHGAVINTILAIFSDGKIGSGKTKLVNACISHLHFLENQWRIKEYNQVHHLSQFNEIKEGMK
ncbi:putative phosphatase [Lederbergia galactosidilyticus]|uniref:histidine phosphatase family protein n=1 Tax=Lederbergia galactosidilytica TaxID=217031 RepID=UPI001AE6E51E|nr:histidine phosphatase family protein [Lederbergia galactosidilytica]MBP1913866.1 putative phosphatase [Lederbergia galactosidilytica]